jgi:hypothetical protein
MEEARRFLRYVIPGLVFIVVLSTTFMLVDYTKVLPILEHMDNVGIVLGVFVVSGGLGYIFSSLYFFIYWIFGEWHVANHVDVIKELNNNIVVRDTRGNDFSDKLTRKNCWVIMNVFWHSRIKNSTRIEGVNSRIDNLSDITHGIGTSVVAAFSAIIVCICLYFYQEVEIDCGKILWILALWVFFTVPSFFQYLRAHNQSQSFVNSVFANEVIHEFEQKDEKEKTKGPISIIFSE